MNPPSALVADRAAVRPEPPTARRPSLARPRVAAAPVSPGTSVVPCAPVAPGTAVSAGAPVVPKVPLSPERLAARRLIDQAKALLIADHSMAEPDAYRWIQKAAMDRRTTMAVIAAGVIAGSEHPESTAEQAAAGDAPTASPSPAQPVEAAG
jgi:hypothetical protein